MTTQTIEITPEAQQVLEITEKFSALLDDVVVTNQQEYDKAGEWLKQIKINQDKLEETRKTLTRPLDESKARIMDLFRGPLDKLAAIAKTLSRARINFADKQEEKRRAEEARLAELQRKEAERLAKRAEKAEEKGQVDKAEELRNKAQETASILPTVVPTFNKTEGIKTITRWKAEVTDLKALVKAIAAGQVSISFIEPNLPQLNKQATATKDTLQIPGVRFYSEKIESR